MSRISYAAGAPVAVREPNHAAAATRTERRESFVGGMERGEGGGEPSRRTRSVSCAALLASDRCDSVGALTEPPVMIPATTATTLAPGTVLQGDLFAEGSIDVHGRVEGKVTARGTVTVSATGDVRSGIDAAVIVIAGVVNGDLRARDRVELEDGARVVGDVSAPSVGIRPGASVRGRIATEAVGDAAEPVAVSPAVVRAPAPGAPSEARRPPEPIVPVLQRRTTRAIRRPR